jgi:NAD(P)-dependent dehydrogenase (short-subunit alcohol dehydrogenase family)
MEKDLAIITGADGGMGEYISCAHAKAGYRVIMACYDPEHGKIIRDKIVEMSGNEDVEVRQIDLSSLSSVKKFTDEILSEGKPVKRLMNNAGILTTNNRKSADGLETLVSVNYVAPYYMTRRLLPLMGDGSRIVNTVSCTYAIGKIEKRFFENGRDGRFYRIPVYSNTKLALFLFTQELAKRVKDRGILVNASDPGIVSTNMIRMNAWFDPITDLIYRPLIKTAAQGASTAIHISLSEEVSGITGSLFAESKKRNVSKRILNHPKQKKLWDDTELLLQEKGFSI